MDAHPQTRVGMPLDEFIRQYDEAPFELVDGERIPLMPPVAEHGEVIRLLIRMLFGYEQINPNIVVYTEMPVVLEDSPNWVKGSRVPDLMIYDKARLNEYKQRVPDWGEKPFILIPDVCVEVISANDNYLDVDDKVEGYLNDGVRLVLVINPRRKAIAVHTTEGIVRLTETDTLDGGDVLPGLSIPVSALFA
ncbi:MAG: Uma2 family endonuclease [Chloroflexota bacterium]